MMGTQHPERDAATQTLSDFGAGEEPELRQPVYDDGNERSCPRCPLRLTDLPAGARGEPIDIPVSAFAMPGISAHLAEHGIETVRSHGWLCLNHDRDVVMPDPVSNHKARAYSDEMVGIKVTHADGEAYYVPVRVEDLSDELATAATEVLQA